MIILIKENFKFQIISKFLLTTYQDYIIKSYGCDCILIIIFTLNGNQANEIYDRALNIICQYC